MDIKRIPIERTGLSNRSQNALHKADVFTVGDMLQHTEESLNEIRNLGKKSIEEILGKIEYYRTMEGQDGQEESEQQEGSAANALMQQIITIADMIGMPEYHDVILEYVKANDRLVRQLGLSKRPLNRLMDRGLEKLSDIIFMTRQDLLRIPSMGASSAEEIMTKIESYLETNETRLTAVCKGDGSAVFDDNAIRDMILQQYQNLGFGGLSLNEMKERLALPECVTEERLKKVIGGLLKDNELEYVDFRCYRVYRRFVEVLDACDVVSDRGRDIIRKRLQGITLEGIAQDYGLTRERVRQIVKRDVQKVSEWHTNSTGMNWFDEDYYRYFYSTYFFEKKDAGEWFGMRADICNYLDMMDVKRGEKDLNSALEDHQGLDAGLRLKIRNYMNRNKLYIDGKWVEKSRAELEKEIVRIFCTENKSFDEFASLYNGFLEQEEIEYDGDIYYTDEVLRTRKNHLADARFLLWKQNEQIRYYDIDGRDYSELLGVLNLESYENIELSTVKFMEMYPEIMEKYDIRDQYELHNLLRKIIPEGSYHDVHFGRMPEIIFGSFDRDEAILDLLIDNAPISISDLCDLIHEEYGYDQAVIQSSYLKPFSQYYHQGVYRIDHRTMSGERREALMVELTEDFYFIDEIRRIFHRRFQDADIEEINPYNLKLMGFIVLSRYAVQHYPSLEAYCEDILTREDVTDITPYRKRLVGVQLFSNKLMELKRNLQIIEFEPNQIINFRRLERSGITREIIQEYCDEVFEFVDDRTFFSIRSIRNAGFESKLFDLGFSDWFYANLLISDKRFSFGQVFGNIILYKGKEDVTIKSFELNRIREHGSIDLYDFMNELNEIYGCRVTDRLDLVYKIQGTEVFHDKILDRLYASEDMYNRELDETEGF